MNTNELITKLNSETNGVLPWENVPKGYFIDIYNYSGIVAIMSANLNKKVSKMNKGKKKTLTKRLLKNQLLTTKDFADYYNKGYVTTYIIEQYKRTKKISEDPDYEPAIFWDYIDKYIRRFVEGEEDCFREEGYRIDIKVLTEYVEDEIDTLVDEDLENPTKDSIPKQVVSYKDLPDDMKKRILWDYGVNDLIDSNPELYSPENYSYEEVYKMAADKLCEQNNKYTYWKDKCKWHYEDSIKMSKNETDKKVN